MLVWLFGVPQGRYFVTQLKNIHWQSSLSGSLLIINHHGCSFHSKQLSKETGQCHSVTSWRLQKAARCRLYSAAPYWWLKVLYRECKSNTLNSNLIYLCSSWLPPPPLKSNLILLFELIKFFTSSFYSDHECLPNFPSLADKSAGVYRRTGGRASVTWTFHFH